MPLPLVEDEYAAARAQLADRHVETTRRFDALAATLGIGEASGGQVVEVRDLDGRQVATPRFEAFLEIRSEGISEIWVTDRTQVRNGYQTDATWRPGRDVEGGTREARALVEKLRDGMRA